jgi:hypothetical protein
MHVAPPSRRLLDNAVTVGFGLALLATGLATLRGSWHLVLMSDDWGMVDRGQSAADLFRPYNGHLAILPILLYRGLFELQGLGASRALQVVTVTSLLAVPAALFALARRRIGPLPALAVGLALLWYPDAFVNRAAFALYWSVLAIVACAHLLARGQPGEDPWLIAAVALALVCSGVGVAGAAGCLAYVVLRRAPRRRVVVVAVPCALWAVWWLLAPDDGSPTVRAPVRTQAAFVADGVRGSFEGLALGAPALGMLLAAGFVALLAWRLARDRPAGLAQLAWTAALAVWWVGLAQSRAHAISPDTFRYQFVGSVFVLLALLPEVTPSWARGPRPAAAPAVAGLAFAVLAAATSAGDLPGSTRQLRLESDRVRRQLIVANLGPEAMPDDVELVLGAFKRLPAGRYREMVDAMGVPPGTRPADVDAALVALGSVRATPTDPPSTDCVPIDGAQALPGPGAHQLRAGDDAVEVQVRRFGDPWVDVGEVAAGEVAAIEVAALGSEVPWQLRAPGACLYARPPVVTVFPPSRAEPLAGSADLAVSVDADAPVEAVEVHARRPGAADIVLGPAEAGFLRWRLTWDTTDVPDGDYELVALATDAAGSTGTSAPVPVTVRNGDG